AIEEKRLLAPAVVLPPGGIGTPSATLNLGGVPEDIPKLILGQVEMRGGNLKGRQEKETKAQHALREKTIEEIAGTLKSLLDDGGCISLRLSIDQQGNDLSLSLSLAGRPGTTLAKNIESLGDTQSAVAGLIGSDSAMSARMTLRLPEPIRKA